MAARLSETYADKFFEFRRVEAEMAEGQPDLQQNFIQAARAIVAFEIEHELPRLKELVTAHGSAVAKIEAAKDKLAKLERAIGNQELYVSQRFPEHDVVGDTLDLIGWKESARLGKQSVQALIAEAGQLESELREFVKTRKGISDCLTVEQQVGWDKTTRESFSWLVRECEQSQQTVTEAT